MTPLAIAQLELSAEKLERQRIAHNMRRTMATFPESERSPVAQLWEKLASMIEEGKFSEHNG